MWLLDYCVPWDMLMNPILFQRSFFMIIEGDIILKYKGTLLFYSDRKTRGNKKEFFCDFYTSDMFLLIVLGKIRNTE